MVQFDIPNPGGNDPNWIHQANVVEAPSANVSAKIGLETLGEGIQGAAHILDTSIKAGIQGTVEEKIGKKKDEWEKGLEIVKANLDKGILPQAVATTTGPNTGKSLLDSSEEEAPLPVGMESGLSRIQQMAYAKQAGSPKINDTDYARDALSIAKQLRAQFPGYISYIDEQVSKASGLPVANSYATNLMLDINRQMAQLGQKKDAMESQMTWGLHEGVEHMDTWMMQRANKDPKYPGDAAVLKAISDHAVHKSNLGIQKQEREASNDDMKTRVIKETQNTTTNANNTIARAVEDNLMLTGLPPVRGLIQYFDDLMGGRIKTSDTEAKQRSAQLKVYDQYLSAKIQKENLPSASIIGGTDYNKIIDAAMSPIRTYITMVDNQQTGAGVFHLEQNKALEADNLHDNWLFNKDRQSLSLHLMGLRHIAGELYFPEALKRTLINGEDKAFAPALQQETLGAMNPYRDKRGEPLDRALIDAVRDGKAKGIGDLDPEYYGKLTSWVGNITDDKMPQDIKDNMINWAFRPKNLGLMDEFKRDYKDPQGNWVPGQYHALNLMGSPTISQAVAESSKAKPENYQMYRKFMENEFGKLYRTDVETLNKIVKQPNLNVHFGFNDTNNQFLLLDQNNKQIVANPRAMGVQYPNQVYMNSMLDVLEKVNGGLKNLTQVHLHDPETQGHQDVPKYLLQALQTVAKGPFGYKPGTESTPITGATGGMMRAIIHSQKPDMTIEEVDKLLLGANK
jgi:hypothetical protein